jgi:hypothetical protein
MALVPVVAGVKLAVLASVAIGKWFYVTFVQLRIAS